MQVASLEANRVKNVALRAIFGLKSGLLYLSRKSRSLQFIGQDKDDEMIAAD